MSETAGPNATQLRMICPSTRPHVQPHNQMKQQMIDQVQSDKKKKKNIVECTPLLTMLIRWKGASINIDIWIDFYGCDMKAAGFKDSSHAAGNDALTNARYDTTSNQDVLHSGMWRLNTTNK